MLYNILIDEAVTREVWVSGIQIDFCYSYLCQLQNP